MAVKGAGTDHREEVVGGEGGMAYVIRQGATFSRAESQHLKYGRVGSTHGRSELRAAR